MCFLAFGRLLPFLHILLLSMRNNFKLTKLGWQLSNLMYNKRRASYHSTEMWLIKMGLRKYSTKQNRGFVSPNIFQTCISYVAYGSQYVVCHSANPRICACPQLIHLVAGFIWLMSAAFSSSYDLHIVGSVWFMFVLP